MEITIQSPLDMHLHVREKEILDSIMVHSAAPFAGAVIMPNLISPVDTREKLLAYKNQDNRCMQKSPFRTLHDPFFPILYQKRTD